MLVKNGGTNSIVNAGQGKWGAGITIASRHFSIFDKVTSSYIVG
jgi:hypothetical protein